MARVMAGDMRRMTAGHAWRDGQDLRVSTTRDHLVIDVDDIRKVRRRVEVVEVQQDIDELVLLAFHDSAERRHHVGVPTRTWADFEAVTTGAATARPRLPWQAVLPRKMLALLVLLLLATACFQGLWFSGHDVTAQVISVDSEDLYMEVTWDDEGITQRDEVGYYEPDPSVGDTVTVRAMPWPLQGRAWGYDGFYETMTVGSVVAGLGSCVWLVVSYVRNVRRPAIRVHAPYVPATSSTTAGSSSNGHRGEDGGEPSETQSVGSVFGVPRPDVSTVDLIKAVGLRSGLDSEPVSAPPPESLVTQVRIAWNGSFWWLAILPLFGAIVFNLSMPFIWGGVAIAGAYAAYAIVTTSWVFIARRSPYRADWSSEWSFVSLSTGSNDYLVMLTVGPSVYWSTHVSGGFPGLTGQCWVRGQLRDGGAVQLRIGDDVWAPDAPVEKMSGEDVAVLRADLFTELAAPDPFRL